MRPARRRKARLVHNGGGGVHYIMCYGRGRSLRLWSWCHSREGKPRSLWEEMHKCCIPSYRKKSSLNMLFMHCSEMGLLHTSTTIALNATVISSQISRSPKMSRVHEESSRPAIRGGACPVHDGGDCVHHGLGYGRLQLAPPWRSPCCGPPLHRTPGDVNQRPSLPSPILLERRQQ